MPHGVSSRRTRRPRASHTKRTSDRQTTAVCDVTLSHYANRAGRIGGSGGGDGGGARVKKESLSTAMKNVGG